MNNMNQTLNMVRTIFFFLLFKEIVIRGGGGGGGGGWKVAGLTLNVYIFFKNKPNAAILIHI